MEKTAPAPADVRDRPAFSPRPTGTLSAEVLTRLGLSSLTAAPTDPRLLAQFLKSDDEADSKVDLDEFSRGIRRAIRVGLALKAQLHRAEGKRWKDWVGDHFEAGYDSFRRFHVAAELQAGLASRGLPLLVSNRQSRALACCRKQAGFWDALATFKEGFPPPEQLRADLEKALGIQSIKSTLTPRIQFHRALAQAIKAVPTESDEPLVAEALSLVRRAISVLENGQARAA